MEFTDSDISNFLTELIELGGSNEVDRNSEKYIRDVASGEVEELTQGNKPKKLAIYGTQARDALIVNPFADGELGNQDNWFYRTRNLLVSGLVARLMIYILENASVDKKEEDKETDGSELIKYIGKYAASIDDKMLTEFKKIISDLESFIKLYYNKQKKVCEVKCSLFNESTKKMFVGIRKSSWEPLQKIVLKLLGTSDLKTLSEGPSSAAIPTFEAYVKVFLNVFEALKEPLKLIEVYVDTTAIRAHLPNLELYYNKAKWCTSCTNGQLPKNNQTQPTAVPWGQTVSPVPVMPVAMPFVQQVNPYVMPSAVPVMPVNPYAYQQMPQNPYAGSGTGGMFDPIHVSNNGGRSGNPFM